jgi:retron-type reverse transcriptase
LAWKEFLNGKRKRKDVRTFETKLADNIFCLHDSLVSGKYKHGSYFEFTIHDPKKRDIHKASVRDRLLHHAIHRKLYKFYDQIFISDSYSCRNGKGIHGALNRFKKYYWKTSRNKRRTVWVLKCDIRKFFDSIDHKILISILSKKIGDSNIIFLLQKIIDSFEKSKGKGIPLGNLTSQLFANIYLNELDQFIKHKLRIKFYIRYADDFVFLSTDRFKLEKILPEIQNFLDEKLKLELHPNKISITTFSSGVDFLGWVNFPNHCILRAVTKRRMLKNLRNNPKPEIVHSYLGLLSHGNTRKLRSFLDEYFL